MEQLDLKTPGEHDSRQEGYYDDEYTRQHNYSGSNAYEHLGFRPDLTPPGSIRYENDTSHLKTKEIIRVPSGQVSKSKPKAGKSSKSQQRIEVQPVQPTDKEGEWFTGPISIKNTNKENKSLNSASKKPEERESRTTRRQPKQQSQGHYPSNYPKNFEEYRRPEELESAKDGELLV
jgi:hypothetical protein